jgi:nucleoside recognition membrane protein YjiH
MLNNGIMILLASLIIVFGFTVPGFIDNTIRTCVDILGVR